MRRLTEVLLWVLLWLVVLKLAMFLVTAVA
jgi:hypothetical protein